MQVPLLDLRREYSSIKSSLDSAVLQVLSDTRFINGPQVREFESAMATYCGCKHAIGVASGTDALLIALKACGVEREDEVITTTFSFFATAGTIHNVAARPVFVDIDAGNFNLNISQIEAKITPRTRAIMPVHLFGQCADLDPIVELAKKHNVKVIEDAAQSISSKYKGKMSGTIGDIGCFSFYPTKNLGAAGDGGMIVTNSDQLAERTRRLKAHGAAVKYIHSEVGYNSRLDTIHAAILQAKLPHLDEWSRARRENAEYYNRRLSGKTIRIPRIESFGYHIFNQYSICVAKRDALREHLKRSGIGTEIYYPLPLHLQECFRYLGHKKGDFPIAEQTSQEIISLPIYPQLTSAEREYVADKVAEFIS